MGITGSSTDLAKYDYKQHVVDTKAMVKVLVEELGLPVFPVHIPRPKIGCSCGRISCSRPGKHPKTADGFKSASKDYESAIKRFGQPTNIGIRTGNGVMVVDIDADKSGIDSLKLLEDAHGALPDTWTVLTGNGYHLYFKVEGHVPCRQGKYGIGEGIDIRGDGGYSIGPKSLHVSGRTYEEDSDTLRDMAIAPAWFVNLIRQSAKFDKDKAQSPDKVIEGARNSYLAQLAGAMRGKGMDPETIEMLLLFENKKKCVPPLDDDEVKKIAKSIGKYAPEKDADPSAWESLLRRNSKGTIKATTSNCAILLRYSADFEGKLAYNEQSDRIIWKEPGPDGFMSPQRGAEFDEASGLFIQNFLGKRHNADFSEKAIHVAARQVGIKTYSYDPVQEYLRSLVWDGVARIDSWLQTYFGAPDTRAIRAMGPKFLISTIARAMVPGCQVDHALILEGPQGLSKSKAIRILGGKDVEGQGWYMNMQTKLESQYSGFALQGHWIIELGELSSMRSASIQKIRSYITEVIDVYKRPYDVEFSQRKRRCVFIGTTNEYDYLPSHERRFWPVRCSTIQVEMLRHDRNQLFAEAFHRWSNGEDWWFERGTKELESIEEAQRARIEEDSWERHIMYFLTERTIVTTDEILQHLGIERARASRKDSMRVSQIMKKFGWHGTRKSIDSTARKHRVWVPLPLWDKVLAGKD